MTALTTRLIMNSHFPTSRHRCLNCGTDFPARTQNWGIQVQGQEPGDAPAPCQPSRGILAPNLLIVHSFSCVSQGRKLNSTVSQGKTHFRFGATARTRLLNMCLCTCLGQVIFPLYSLAPLSTKTGTMKFLFSVKYFKIYWKQPLCKSETWYH